MSDYQLETTHYPNWQDVEKIRAELSQHIFQEIGSHVLTNVACFARDDNAVLTGGAYGWIQFGWLFVDLFWVEESCRHQGLGTKIMSAMETAAQEKGINRYYLTTASFQALEIYQNMGYHITDEMEMFADDGSAFVRYSLQKIAS